MTGNEDLEPDLVRKIATHSIQTLQEAHRSVVEQHADSFKWITASLLAINGGAAVALLNADSIRGNLRVIPGGLFTAGILCALLVAVVTQKISARALPHLHRKIGWWIGKEHDGLLPENFEEDDAKTSSEITKFAWTIPAIGWLSAILFALGMLFAARAISASQLSPASTSSVRSEGSRLK